MGSSRWAMDKPRSMILKVRPEAMLEVLEAGTLVREDWEGVVQGVCQVSLISSFSSYLLQISRRVPQLF